MGDIEVSRVRNNFFPQRSNRKKQVRQPRKGKVGSLGSVEKIGQPQYLQKNAEWNSTIL